MAALLALAERVGRRRYSLAQVSISAGWLLGLAQMLALVPEGSPSGSTLTAALLMGSSGMVWWNAVPKTPTWGIWGQRLSRSWMVQGGFVMERGQGNELVQGRQLTVANPLARLKPFTTMDNAMPHGSDGEASQQGWQHGVQPTGQGAPPSVVQTEGVLLPWLLLPAPAHQATHLCITPVPGPARGMATAPPPSLQQSQLMAGATGIHHQAG